MPPKPQTQQPPKSQPVDVERIPDQAPVQAGGFESRGALSEVKTNTGGMSAIAREEGEIKAAVVLARSNPRDELVSYNKLMKSCQRPAFAENSTYSFPRGDKTIEGPSVDLAREAARVWGNIRYGLQIVSDDEESVHIRAVAMDLETNNSVAAEDKFKKLVQRKVAKGQPAVWVKPDERDLRELINRRGAICIRNALLQLLPPDLIDEALLKSKETLRAAATGQLKQDPQRTIRSLVAAFEQIGVSSEMLKTWLEHDLEIVNAEEIAELRGIYKSIADGNSRREEHFEIPKAKGGPETGSLDASSITGKQVEEKPTTEKPKE